MNPFLRRLSNFGKLPFQPTVRRVRQWHARRTLAGDDRRQSRGAAKLPDWAREPHWYGRGAPPRQHNRVTSLIDGEAYFRRLHTELLNAQHSVYIAGWCCTPQFPLLRDSDQAMIESRFADVLARVASRLPVRVLLWAGSPALYPPTHEFAEAAAREFNSTGASNLVCRLDDTRSGTQSHHQKAVVIDGRLAFIAGIDVTMLDGDRWDRIDHPLRMGPTWHDAGVLLEGDAVQDVQSNFIERWTALTGERDLPALSAPFVGPASAAAQIVRTLPEDTYPDIEPEYGTYHAHIEAIRNASRYVYIEGPYLWSKLLVDALLERITNPPSDEFRVILVLPAFGFPGQSTNTKNIEKLRDASGTRPIMHAFSLYTAGPAPGERPMRYRSTYVHSKICIVDDEWVITGSANLNDRSFVDDSELGVLVRDREFASSLRGELWAEHLGLAPQLICERPVHELVDEEWTARAARNVAIVEAADQPLTSAVVRYGTDIPGDSLILEAVMIGAPEL